jgi:hypothetical protein
VNPSNIVVISDPNSTIYDSKFKLSDLGVDLFGTNTLLPDRQARYDLRNYAYGKPSHNLLITD